MKQKMSLWLLVALLVTMVAPSISFAFAKNGETTIKTLEVEQVPKASEEATTYKVDLDSLGLPEKVKPQEQIVSRHRRSLSSRRNIVTMFSMGADRSTPDEDEVNPNKGTMTEKLLNLRLPLKLEIITEKESVNPGATQKALADILGAGKKIQVIIKQMYRGRLIETYTSQEFNADGIISGFTDSKGANAANVPVYNAKTGYRYDYVIESKNEVAYDLHFQIQAGYNKMNLTGIYLTYRLTHLANSEIRVEVKDADGSDYDLTKLDQTKEIQAKFNAGLTPTFKLPIFGTKNDSGTFEKVNPKTNHEYSTVLREDWGDQKLVDLNNLRAGLNDITITRDGSSSWNDDMSIDLNLKENGKTEPFKVTVKYDYMTGGLITFTRVNKVIKINEGDPVPKTHNKLVFQAGEHGNLKDGDKSVKTVTFAVYKGMTWAEAKADPEIKLYIPTTQPEANYKLDNWYKFENNAVDKNSGLPDDSTEVAAATYQAEFIGKDGVVDVTPKTPEDKPDPNGTPKLPEKDNPDFDPTKPANDTDNKKKVPDIDYVIVNLKSGEHGTLNKDKDAIKSYAVLKTMTWDAAEKINETGKTKLVIPQGNPDPNYEVDKWNPALPTDKTQTFATIFGSDTTKTYVLQFKYKKTVVDVTPDPGKDPKLPEKDNPNYDPDKPENNTTNPKKIPDEDYVIVNFKSGENGTLNSNNDTIKSYAILKVKTWKEAEAANDDVKFRVPNGNPATDYENDKWTPDLPKDDTEKGQTLATIVGENKTSKDYTLSFKKKDKVKEVTPGPGEEPKLPEKDNPDYNPDGPNDETNPKKIPDTDYTIIDFKTDGNGYLDASKTERKSFAVLKTSTWKSAQEDPAAGTTAAKLIVPSTADGATMKLTPKTDYDFTSWAPTLPDDTTKISDIPNVKNNMITFTANFTKRGDLIVPTIVQDVKDFDQASEKKVVKVTFNGDPTTGSKAQLVKVGSDGSETPIGDVFDPTNGDSFRDIIETEGDANRLVNGDKVKVKVTKDGSSPKYSNEIELDLEAPKFSDLKVERINETSVKISGKITDNKNDIKWIECDGTKVTQFTDVAGEDHAKTFEIVTTINTTNEYQLKAKDAMANTSKDDDQSTKIKDTTPEEQTPVGKYVELIQPYEGQTKLLVTGQGGYKLVAFNYVNGKRNLLGKATIEDRKLTAIINVSQALAKWDYVHVVVLDKANEASYDSITSEILDKMDFGANLPTGMRVKPQNPNDQMPPETNPGNPSASQN